MYLAHYTKRFIPEFDAECRVYDGFKAACPNDNAVKNNWFKEKLIYVKDYDGKTFGGDVIFSAVNDLS